MDTDFNYKPIKLNNKKLKFPLSYDLKVVMNSSLDEVNKEIISCVLKEIKIPHEYLDTRESTNGTYKRYSVKVTLISHSKMLKMYESLSKCPEVKNVL
ncbi:MAG TPA: DUF493 family protein [Spirochaetota bacterium]|nr:DUF493 family protein [Spirochaetota bacterium]